VTSYSKWDLVILQGSSDRVLILKPISISGAVTMDDGHTVPLTCPKGNMIFHR
jgi:hypothetical protein